MGGKLAAKARPSSIHAPGLVLRHGGPGDHDQAAHRTARHVEDARPGPGEGRVGGVGTGADMSS